MYEIEKVLRGPDSIKGYNKNKAPIYIMFAKGCWIALPQSNQGRTRRPRDPTGTAGRATPELRAAASRTLMTRRWGRIAQRERDRDRDRDRETGTETERETERERERRGSREPAPWGDPDESSSWRAGGGRAKLPFGSPDSDRGPLGAGCCARFLRREHVCGGYCTLSDRPGTGTGQAETGGRGAASHLTLGGRRRDRERGFARGHGRFMPCCPWGSSPTSTPAGGRRGEGAQSTTSRGRPSESRPGGCVGGARPGT
jgi:hypothetical protein